MISAAGAAAPSASAGVPEGPRSPTGGWTLLGPFDDTLETVIERLISITNKARNRWPGLGSTDTLGAVEVEEDTGLNVDLPLAEEEEETEFHTKEMAEDEAVL